MNMLVPLSTPYEYIKKHSVKKQTTKISTSGIAVVIIVHGYSRQCCKIGFFSATAGLLV